VRPQITTWGGMLSEATHWFQIAPNFMLFSGLVIFITCWRSTCSVMACGTR
jgi:peptide/nickel transport system permease protein